MNHNTSELSVLHSAVSHCVDDLATMLPGDQTFKTTVDPFENATSDPSYCRVIIDNDQRKFEVAITSRRIHGAQSSLNATGQMFGLALSASKVEQSVATAHSLVASRAAVELVATRDREKSNSIRNEWIVAGIEGTVALLTALFSFASEHEYLGAAALTTGGLLGGGLLRHIERRKNLWKQVLKRRETLEKIFNSKTVEPDS